MTQPMYGHKTTFFDDPEIIAQVRAAANAQGITLSGWIRQIIRRELRERAETQISTPNSK